MREPHHVLIGTRRVQQLKRPCDTAVQQGAAGAAEAVVERVTDQRVREVVLDPRRVAALAKKLRRERLLKRVDQALFVVAADRAELFPREPARECGGRRQHAVARVGQSRQPAGDHFARAIRYRHLRNRQVRRPTVAFAKQLAVFHQVQQHLPDEEGVSARLRTDRFDERLRCFLLADDREQFPDGLRVEPAQLQALEPGQAVQVRRQGGERVSLFDLNVAIRADDEHP